MRKADPNRVITDFETKTASALKDWQSIDAAITASATDTLRLRRRAASDSLLVLMVSWETFISSWMTAAVNRDTSTAVARLTRQINTYATGALRVPTHALSQTHLATSHLTLSDVHGLLDDQGYNIAIRDKKELAVYETQWLAGPYQAAAQSVTAFNFMPAVVGRLVRNALAHQSTSALAEANRVVRQGSTPAIFKTNPARRRDLDVAAWRAYVLQSFGTQTRPRIERFHEELQNLAGRFRVP